MEYPPLAPPSKYGEDIDKCRDKDNEQSDNICCSSKQSLEMLLLHISEGSRVFRKSASDLPPYPGILLFPLTHCSAISINLEEMPNNFFNIGYNPRRQACGRSWVGQESTNKIKGWSLYRIKLKHPGMALGFLPSRAKY